MFTHHIRIGKVTHAVVSSAKKFKKGGHTLCATRIGDDATVLAPFRIGDDRRHDITCDTCLNSHTAMENVLETDFGYPSPLIP